MNFKVLDVGASIPQEKGAYLRTDNWDDWFTYSTQYALYVVGSNLVPQYIGEVKIGQMSMEADQRRPMIPGSFGRLGSEFFSVGQDGKYYENLGKCGADVRAAVLVALQDMAYDPLVFARAINEKVTRVSLLRSVTETEIKGQYRRIAQGGARLTAYDFVYRLPVSRKDKYIGVSFSVRPESFPPTNVHVVIGRNGVGKSRLLTYMAKSLVESDENDYRYGDFSFVCDGIDDGLISNVVSVGFSAFDSFEPPVERTGEDGHSLYSYIGLKRIRGSNQWVDRPKSSEMLADEFVDSVMACRAGSRFSRWVRTLKTLESDPIFKDAGVSEVAQDIVNDASAEDPEVAFRNPLSKTAKALFRSFSSGHKIVLLTMTRLVEVIEEKSLVLIDEPESHLHPPLLSAFVRSLSDLLIERNGVAVIATHSPVVLQEVPRSCVWKLRRNGEEVQIERPLIETFGENVGVLTSSLFHKSLISPAGAG